MSSDLTGNVIEVTENGPFVVTGEIRFLDPNEELVSSATSAELCRCGHSKTKPFCDGSHEPCGFIHVATELDGKVGEPATGPDALSIEPLLDGPFFVTGSFSLVSSDGKVTCSGTKTVLCRCAFSENKPFCDGSHKDHGFQAPVMGA
jgi:CDGSH-type Zn-finger protein